MSRLPCKRCSAIGRYGQPCSGCNHIVGIPPEACWCDKCCKDAETAQEQMIAAIAADITDLEVRTRTVEIAALKITKHPAIREIRDRLREARTCFEDALDEIGDVDNLLDAVTVDLASGK